MHVAFCNRLFAIAAATPTARVCAAGAGGEVPSLYCDGSHGDICQTLVVEYLGTTCLYVKALGMYEAVTICWHLLCKCCQCDTYILMLHQH